MARTKSAETVAAEMVEATRKAELKAYLSETTITDSAGTRFVSETTSESFSGLFGSLASQIVVCFMGDSLPDAKAAQYLTEQVDEAASTLRKLFDDSLKACKSKKIIGKVETIRKERVASATKEEVALTPQEIAAKKVASLKL